MRTPKQGSLDHFYMTAFDDCVVTLLKPKYQYRIATPEQLEVCRKYFDKIHKPKPIKRPK